MAPRHSRTLTWSTYDGTLCPREPHASTVVRDEEAFLETLACASQDGQLQPSGIDWSTHELFVTETHYQGSAGRFVFAADAPEGRIAQFDQPPYCQGPAPPEGDVIWGLLLPRREAGEVTVIGCEPQPCDWELDGRGPPA
ncbi:MAG: hypothetical protein KDK70_33265 [Myxococcales bacterium]|nr:hypothetical protein [Myxococcales bacterium]